MDKKRLATIATARALQIRRKSGLQLWSPMGIYELLEKENVDVRFTDIPSMEGVYLPGPPSRIVLSSLRPAGRRAFTAAHELGHHCFGHGARYDELVEEKQEARNRDPDEFLADCFAGALLMPKVAVDRAFKSRDLDAATCDETAFFRVSAYLGVGYSTLLDHMRFVLQNLPETRVKALSMHTPACIRKTILGKDCPENLIPVDPAWVDRPIDAEVSDLILLDAGVKLEGKCLEMVKKDPKHVLLRAVAPGIGRVYLGTWASFVRVSRKNFIGRAIFRFEPEVDDA